MHVQGRWDREQVEGTGEESKLKEGCRDGENRGAGREQGEGFALEVIASPRYCSSPSMLRGPGEISPCIPDLPNDTFSPSPWNIFIPSPLRLLFFWRGEEEWKKCMKFAPFFHLFIPLLSSPTSKHYRTASPPVSILLCIAWHKSFWPQLQSTLFLYWTRRFSGISNR